MRWEEWKFSARLGSQDAFLRWTSILAMFIVFAMGIFLMVRVLPEGWRSGVVTFHYNIYLGIDDVRPWPWIFAVPGAAILTIAFDVLFSLGLFRKHPLASRTMMVVALASAIAWAIGSFFLMLVNL
ncbi:MAG: hypothetical protein WC787_00020 [Patescibacteria group bacterium]|jgi:hypothetical protein